MSVLVSTRIDSEYQDSDQPRMASLLAAVAMVPRKVAAEQSLETVRRTCQPAFHRSTAQHTSHGRLGKAADSSAPSTLCTIDHRLPATTVQQPRQTPRQ